MLQSEYYDVMPISYLPRMLADMGEALDWVRQLTLDNKWKSMKVRIGPGVYIMICAHPDAAQIVLKSGRPVSVHQYPWLFRL